MTLLILSFALISSFSYAQTQNYLQWSDQILSDFSRANWKSEACVDSLQTLAVKLDQIQLKATERSELETIAPQLIDRLWAARLMLHDRLEGSSHECAREIRNTFRRFRFLEDILGEIAYHPENLDPTHIKFSKQPVPIDEKAPGYFLQTRDENFNIQPGDLIIARGVSFLSAMISRLGDIDSQFSHVVFVTENPETQKIETIESYVGSGVAIYERATALKNENARLLVLRPKNRALAKKASEDMRATVASRTGLNKIHYDYALDFKDHETLSCAEVAQVAFLNASNGSFMLPERPSRLSRGIDLVESLGIAPGDTFTPGDLEYDSRFEIVGEWRDLRLTRDSRLKDAILSKMLDWMDHREYILHDSFKSKMARGFIYSIRRTFLWPLVKKALKLDDFSKEIPRSMVGTVTLINEFGADLLTELRKRDQAFEAKNGFPMTYLDLYEELEKIRSDDEALYANKKTRKKSLILKYVH